MTASTFVLLLAVAATSFALGNLTPPKFNTARVGRVKLVIFRDRKLSRDFPILQIERINGQPIAWIEIDNNIRSLILTKLSSLPLLKQFEIGGEWVFPSAAPSDNITSGDGVGK